MSLLIPLLCSWGRSNNSPECVSLFKRAATKPMNPQEDKQRIFFISVFSHCGNNSYRKKKSMIKDNNNKASESFALQTQIHRAWTGETEKFFANAPSQQICATYAKWLPPKFYPAFRCAAFLYAHSPVSCICVCSGWLKDNKTPFPPLPPFSGVSSQFLVSF